MTHTAAMNLSLFDAPLSPAESTTLAAQEAIIERGLATFIEVGAALLHIRDHRLYRGEFHRFEDYCQARWAMTRQHANRLIAAADVVGNLEPIGSILPATESQARPLIGLEPDEQRAVWQEAVDSAPNGRVTAAHIAHTVDEYLHDNGDAEVAERAKAGFYITLEQWNTDRPLTFSTDNGSKFNETNDNIEWAAWSWNPVTGCLHDCPYCYARDIANRFFAQKFAPSFLPERLSAPRNTKPRVLDDEADIVQRMAQRNVFVCSMADLFGKWVPNEWIEAVLQQAWDKPQWTFLFLTKFPIRMADFDFPPNSWIGTTVDRQWAVERAEKAFSKIRAGGYQGIAWLSCEPMMEDLTFCSLDMFDWVVMGGSSKSTQTPEFFPPFEWKMHLYQQAKACDLPVYMKTNFGVEPRVREYPAQTLAG